MIISFFIIGAVSFVVLSSKVSDLFLWYVLPVIIFCASAQIVVVAIYSIYEGFGLVSKVNKYKSIQEIFAYSSMAIGIILGFGINSIAAIFVTRLFVAVLLIINGGLNRYVKFNIKHNSLNIFNNQGQEVDNFKKNIAISWISGYMIYHAIIPVLFRMGESSSVVALGFMLQLSTGITNISSTWVGTRIPDISRLISYNKIDQSFIVAKSAVREGFIISVIASFLLLSSKLFLDFMNYNYEEFTGNFLFFSCFILFGLINYINTVKIIILRSFVEENTHMISFWTGVFIFIYGVIAAHYSSLELLPIGFLLASLVSNIFINKLYKSRFKLI